MIALGGNEIKEVYLGSLKISLIYLNGNTLLSQDLKPNPNPSGRYITIYSLPAKGEPYDSEIELDKKLSINENTTYRIILNGQVYDNCKFEDEGDGMYTIELDYPATILILLDDDYTCITVDDAPLLSLSIAAKL